MADDKVTTAETVDEWRAVEALSKSSFYELQKSGRGPQMLRVPDSKIVRVIESHASWRARMAALAASEAGELETERRRQLARDAGQRAAASSKHSANQSVRKRLMSPTCRGTSDAALSRAYLVGHDAKAVARRVRSRVSGRRRVMKKKNTTRAFMSTPTRSCGHGLALQNF